MLMLAEFEDGGQMDDTELRDQLMTLLLAGHETTATALAWTFDLLLRHPAALERLRYSLEAGEEDYLRATISESLRLRPVIPLAGRRLANDLTVDGLDLPAGTDVSPAIWLTHTRADLYPEPFAFQPERFLESSPDTYGWIPYRRRHPPLPRRLLRRVRDADRAARGDHPLRAAQGLAGAGEDRPPQHHPFAQGRHPGGHHRPPSRPRAGARHGLARPPSRKFPFQRDRRRNFLSTVSAMMEAMMRQTWSDDRLDDLNRKVDTGFAQIEVRSGEVNARFDRIDERLIEVEKGLVRVEARLDSIEEVMAKIGSDLAAFQRTVIQVLGGLTGTVIVGAAAILATQL